MAFYCANLPCSAKKYAKMNELRDRAFAFLTTTSIGKTWESSQQLVLQGFNTSIYELCEIASVDGMKQSVKDSLLTCLSRDQLYELLAWFYLSALGLASY